jgi:hypothetical protein
MARITLHDALGRTLTVLHDGLLGPGVNSIMIPLQDRAPGAYVVRLEVQGSQRTMRLVRTP